MDAALRAHDALAWTAIGTVSFPEAEVIVRRGIDAARRAKSRQTELSIEYQLLKVQVGLGQLDDAEETAERGNAYDTAMTGWSRVSYAATRALAEGRWDDAEALSEATLPLGQLIGETNHALHRSRMQRLVASKGLVEESRRWYGEQTDLLSLSTLAGMTHHLLTDDREQMRETLESWPTFATGVPNMMQFYHAVVHRPGGVPAQRSVRQRHRARRPRAIHRVSHRW